MTESTQEHGPPPIESIVVWGWLGLFLLSVAALAVNVPYYDEWFHLRRVLGILDGAPALAGLFEWVNGSRLVLFRSLLLGSLRIFGAYSPLPFMAASTLCTAFTAFCGVRLLRQAMAPSWLRTTACFTVVALAASLAQHEVLLWGLEFSLALPVALAVLGALAIPYTSPHLRIRFALMLSLLGLLSFAAGMGLFVALGFALWRSGATRRTLLTFAGISLVVLVGWHAGFTTDSTGANLTAATPDIAEKLWRIPAHFLAALGSGTTASVLWPIARKGGGLLTSLAGLVAVAAGLAPLAVFGIDLFRGPKREPLSGAAWTFFLFGLSTAFFIAAGRHDQGISQALSSRYVTLTVLAPFGTVLLLARDGRRWALGLFAAAALANAAAGGVVAYAFREARVEGAASLPFVREFPELPGFEALAPDFPHDTAADLMKRRMIPMEMTPTGIRFVIEQSSPAASTAQCAVTPPGALTPTYRKPTPAIAGFEVNIPRPGQLIIVGRSAGGIRGLFAETVNAPGIQPARTTLKGVPSGPVDLEAWLVTSASTDFLTRVGACRTAVSD